jgi:hypothetical protein
VWKVKVQDIKKIILGYDAVYFDRSLPVLWRNLPPSLKVEE